MPSIMDVTGEGLPKFKELMNNFSNLFPTQDHYVVIEKRELQ